MNSFLREHLGLILTFLIIPLLYAIGYMFELGYIRAYGLSDSMFNHGINYYLMNSFYTVIELLNYLYKHISQCVLFLVAVCFLASIQIFTHLRFSDIVTLDGFELKHFTQYLKKIKNETLRSSAIAIFAGFASFLLIISILYVLLLIIMLPIMAHKAGKTNAQTEIQNFQVCDINKPRKDCAFIYEGKDLITSGRIVISNQQFVAVFNGMKTKVISIGTKEIDIVVK